MNAASKTWALVVGIDRYEDPAVKPLSGAVADAVAFADWLRALGVPDRQVILHAAPTRASRQRLKGRKPAPATDREIQKSVARLEKVKTGERLIVYLAGHGLYEPSARRLFLLEEFTQAYPANMAIELYINRFLSMGFKRQFLFLDGCQNLPYSPTERQRIQPAMFATGFTPQAENFLVACFAASQEQLAREVDGHGLFTRSLLEGIDFTKAPQEAVGLDFETGQRFLDVKKLVTEYVRPIVQATAPTPQTPIAQMYPGETTALWPFYTFRDDEQAGCLTLDVAPSAAAGQVERVAISVAQQQLWSCSRPRPPSKKLDLPFEVRVPVGMKVTASCVLQRGSSWTGETEHLVPIAPDTPVTFNLQPPPPHSELPGVLLKTVQIGGAEVLDRFSYDDVAANLGVRPVKSGRTIAPGVMFYHHESGPAFELLRPSSEAAVVSRRLAADWARAIVDVTPEDVGVSTTLIGSPAAGTRPRLRFRFAKGGAEALAGPVAIRNLVWIGRPENAPLEALYEAAVGQAPAGSHSLAALEEEPDVEVEPGHAQVRVDLPWGSWATTIEAVPASSQDVRLPSTVGQPPLRVRLAGEPRRRGSFIFGAKGRAPVITLRNGISGQRSSRFKAVRGGSAHWALSAPDAAWVHTPEAVPIAAAGRWSFPFLAGRSFGFERGTGWVRVEPLSSVPSTAWDVLLFRGLLDALPPEKALDLTRDKWDDLLLGIAGAYAVYALPPDEANERLLAVAVRNLSRLSKRHLAADVADIDLLRAALTTRGGKPLTPADQRSLERWARVSAVPILRWGIPIAIRLIEDAVVAGEPFDRWLEDLRRIEEGLSPVSVWTAWGEPPRRARPA